MSIALLFELAIELITFGIVVAASVALINRVMAQATVRRRLGEHAAAPTRQQTSGLVKDGQVTNPFLLWVQRSTSLSDTKDRAKLTRDLAMGGIRNPAAPTLYVVLRFGLAIGLPLGFLLMQQFASKPFSSSDSGIDHLCRNGCPQWSERATGTGG